ncbi:hypothetical protein YC2023_050078 [Brassica napus]
MVVSRDSIFVQSRLTTERIFRVKERDYISTPYTNLTSHVTKKGWFCSRLGYYILSEIRLSSVLYRKALKDASLDGDQTFSLLP